jgi:hypothetical protein
VGPAERPIAADDAPAEPSVDEELSHLLPRRRDPVRWLLLTVSVLVVFDTSCGAAGSLMSCRWWRCWRHRWRPTLATMADW